jgi:hypothetical protein
MTVSERQMRRVANFLMIAVKEHIETYGTIPQKMQQEAILVFDSTEPKDYFDFYLKILEREKDWSRIK